jgi:beta-N-acetylhexosaminidase
VDEAAVELTRRANGRPIVVVSRDTHRHAWARALVERLPDVVLVEMGWPASWRPSHARAYVASYGASRANAAAVAELLSS